MKIGRIALLLTTIVCLALVFSIICSANTDDSVERLSDKNNYISSAESAELERKLQSAEEKTGVAFRVYVYKYSSSVGYVDMYSYEREMGESFENLVLLVVSYEYGTYYYELFTKGIADTEISDKEANKILDNDNVYDNIKAGMLYEGISAFVELSEKAVTGNLRNSFKSVLIPSLVISILVAVGVVVFVVLRYRKKLHSVSYPLEKYATLDLSIANDNFIHKTVTSVRVNSSNDSSRGGGRISGGGSRGRR